MARGFGASASGQVCCCEDRDMKNWHIITMTKVKSGKQCGKPKATVRCDKCRCQWDTTAKYIERLSALQPSLGRENRDFIRKVTNMDKSRWKVHETHCCVLHGCKYGDEDCPVITKEVQQQYLCESCDDDNIKSVEEVILKSDGFFKISPNKMYAKVDGEIVIINGYEFSGDVITLSLISHDKKTVSAYNVVLLQKV